MAEHENQQKPDVTDSCDTNDNDNCDEKINNDNDNRDIISDDIKTSDLGNPVTCVESESERRCTSTSGNGESEYESVNEEEDDHLRDADDDMDKSNDIRDENTDSQIDTIDCHKSDDITVNEDTNNCNDIDNNNDIINDIINDIDDEKSKLSCDANEISNECTEETHNDDSQLNELNDKIEDNVIKDNTDDDKIDCNDQKSCETLKDNVIKTVDSTVDSTVNDTVDNVKISEVNADLNDDDDDDYEDFEDTDDSRNNSNDENSNDGEDEYHDGDYEEAEGERQRGDGEESEEQQNAAHDKVLDDDEDKRNPQYIPKRGPFYEHDDRVTEETGEKTVEKPKEIPEKPIIIAKKPPEEDDPKKNVKKKLWNESDRWGHDLFDEHEQAPKTRDELTEIYGYDIRGEDDPPKARRRKRYGRGPTKYTRQWQDEYAYNKQTAEHTERTERGRPIKGDTEDIQKRERNFRNDRDRNRMPIRKYHDKNDEIPLNRAEHNRFRNDKINQSNKPVSNRPPQSFSNEDFPELPSNESQKKKLQNFSNAHHDAWKKTPPLRQNAPQTVNTQNIEIEKEYKTEPMKVIDAIENKTSYGDVTADIVRTQTFENSKYTQRRSSNNYEHDDRVRGKSRVDETSGRAIRKTNNSAANYNANREAHNDNYHIRNNSGRTERNLNYNDEPSQNIRYYDDRYQSSEGTGTFITDVASGMQKLSINEKMASNRNSDNEQPRSKRYSSLRQQQQQRVMPENIPNIRETHIQQGQGNGTNLNINQHNQHPQFYENPQVQRTSYYQDAPARNTYMPPNAPDLPQQHPPRFIPQPMQPYILQAGPTSEPPRFITPAVPTTGPSPAQPTGPPPVLSAPPPPGPAAYMSPYTPPGYPQFPPPPAPPTHVPPGYHTAIVAAPQPPPLPPLPPSQQQLAELFRGGVTYYDTSSQQHSPRQVPQRRPKAAIPIVPPPESHPGDGDGDKSYVSVNS